MQSWSLKQETPRQEILGGMYNYSVLQCTPHHARAPCLLQAWFLPCKCSLTGLGQFFPSASLWGGWKHRHCLSTSAGHDPSRITDIWSAQR